MNICFTGDMFLGGDLLNQDTTGIINVDLFNKADIRVVNLEQSISDTDYVENKCTLYTGSYALEQLDKLGVTAVNIAHNHIQDKGLAGINETIIHLNKAGIGCFGAGRNISESKKAYPLSSEIMLLGYCEFNRPYLKQIEVAEENKAGVNPLRYESVLEDLNNLSNGKKAILYFHWGREHVWFPPHHDIKLAKRLLEDERVLLIVGMHAHRPQGYIEHNGKRAYMCLGNFLFPNFFVKPPTQIYYPNELPKEFDVTRQYHSVYKITYKKWRWVNRASIVLEFNTVTKEVSHTFVVQDDQVANVKELQGIKLFILRNFITFLSLLYKISHILYTPIEKFHIFVFESIWKLQIFIFQSKQTGLKRSFIRIFGYFGRKIKI